MTNETHKRPSRKGVAITPHKGGRTAQLNARIRPEVKAQLDQLVERLGVSIADLLEQLIEDAWRRDGRE